MVKSIGWLLLLLSLSCFCVAQDLDFGTLNKNLQSLKVLSNSLKTETQNLVPESKISLDNQKSMQEQVSTLQKESLTLSTQLINSLNSVVELQKGQKESMLLQTQLEQQLTASLRAVGLWKTITVVVSVVAGVEALYIVAERFIRLPL